MWVLSYFWFNQIRDMGKWEILRILKLITVIILSFSVLCFCICLFEEFIYFILNCFIIFWLFSKVSSRWQRRKVTLACVLNLKAVGTAESFHLFICIILSVYTSNHRIELYKTGNTKLYYLSLNVNNFWVNRERYQSFRLLSHSKYICFKLKGSCTK